MLRVENLSVIESVSVEFTEGLNIITGETGAGKSVFIGALSLVLGARFSRTLFRDPEKKITVEAEFLNSENIPAELAEQFETADGIIIRREIDKTGKNRIFINGRMATVEQLRELTASFCDIHGQHEHQQLLDNTTHMSFIDSLVDSAPKETYAECWSRFSELKSRIAKIKADRQLFLREKDMLEFQLGEIDGLKINLEEDSKIEDRINVLSNLTKIIDNSSKSLQLLRDGEVNAYELITSAASALHGISQYSETINKAADQLAEMTYLLNDVMEQIESVADASDTDPEELDRLVDRKYKLQNLMKKYGPELSDVCAFAEKVSARLKDMEFSDESLSKLEKELGTVGEELKAKADKLNAARRKAADVIENSIIENLNELELKNSVFKVVFEKTEDMDASAGLKAEFHISTNRGFEPGPIQKVASGGEISRVMLAMKEVFAAKDRVQTLVFDEIDTGISGKTAKQVAVKLKKVADARQVIVITHLPVVACAGRKHLHITKSADTELARTEINEIDGDTRLGVLAQMIAGNDTPSAVAQAKEMIEDMKNA
ncbi:DNA repair protein RecN [Seleniivibrio woodruffii]|uniref:DNA repair protein RecN n=1 Tax=Seleniivibrio woodruffii TaxID=1078050 RepID=UPI00240993AC|nr:DNA repair protein RecN [Seleniivibrio woodruffii]